MMRHMSLFDAVVGMVGFCAFGAGLAPFGAAFLQADGIFTADQGSNLLMALAGAWLVVDCAADHKANYRYGFGAIGALLCLFGNWMVVGPILGTEGTSHLPLYFAALAQVGLILINLTWLRRT